MTISLAVTKRDDSKKLGALRAAGDMPGVVYGPKQEPITIAMSQKDFDKVLEEAGESTIVELTGLEKPIEVLIKDVDFDPAKRGYRHVDFYAIERGKEMTVNVPLEFIGVAPAEKSGVGTVTKVLHEIEVTCRPSLLPAEIEVDLSVLVDEESIIHVSDLKVAEGVVIENEGDETVAVVSVAKEEVDEAPAAVDMSSIEVEEKGKKDDEEAE